MKKSGERTILNTRPENGGDEFVRILTENKFEVINFPMIEIIPVKDFSEIDSKLDSISKYDGIIFTSINAVKIFLGRASNRNINIECRIFAVGDKTGNKVKEFNLNCEDIPAKSDSESLSRAILDKYGAGGKYLFPKGRIGMNSITNAIRNVDELIVYDTVSTSDIKKAEEIKKLMTNGGIDCIAFFSPSAAENFGLLFQDFKGIDIPIAVIGETTRNKVLSKGFKAEIMPDKYISEELAYAIIKYFND